MNTVACAIVAAGLATSGIVAQDASAPAPKDLATRAQPNSAPIQADASSPGKKVTSFNKASSFLGMPIQSEGKQIGKVKEMVFDLEKGRIGYVVLALEGTDGKNQRLVPVPISAVKPDEQGKHLVLNMSEPVLAAAEGIAEGDLPAVTTFAIGGAAEAETGTGRSSDIVPTEPTPSEPASPASNVQPQDRQLVPKPQ